LVSDPVHMSLERSPSMHQTSKGQLDVAPPRRSMVYPVVVPAVESRMERQGWKPRRSSTSADPRKRGQFSARRSQANEPWPPPGSQSVSITVFGASGLPGMGSSIRAGQSTVCEIAGKSQSRVKTRVAGTSEGPAGPCWNETLILHGWKQGDSLELSVLDRDLKGIDHMLASTEVQSADFFPDGFQGTLHLENKFFPGNRHLGKEVRELNLAANPVLDIRILLLDPEDPDAAAYLGGKPSQLSVQTAKPSVSAVCQHLDNFEANMKPVPLLGNFWMTPRGDNSIHGNKEARRH